jgi:NAD(P)-dependent dehydrogenase (short-subunit alcohol dehydrogenase family)
MQLKGVAAIVTGGASGLGASTARMLAGRGAQVAVFDINEPAARDLVRDIGGVFCKVDVSEEGSVLEGLAEAQRRHGVARILVNCAGVPAAIKTVTRHNACHPLDTFRRVIEINLIGTFNVISKFAARLCAWETEEEERGVVINTASVAAYDGQIGQAAYAASKAGVVGLTLPVARDLALHRIRVVTLAPGLFLTPMMMGLAPEVRDSLGAQVPHPNRLGRPEEYAQLVDSIIANPMVNGEVIRIDGALRMAPR